MDVVSESANEGIDNVVSSVGLSLASNVENLRLDGLLNINGVGNSLDNSLVGNAGANSLSGEIGNDTLDGGEGLDTLLGGVGDDIYLLGDNVDLITEYAGEGIDLVRSSTSYTLASYLENLTLIGLNSVDGMGNELNNIILGNESSNTLVGASGNDSLSGAGGNDTLEGGVGVDTLIGGLGDDHYVVDIASDVVTERASEGTDVVYSSVTMTLAANVENIVLTGIGVINATGNSANNILIGNAVANSLDGRGGADTMSGGAGNDLYVVDSVSDSVIELLNEGTDRINSSVSYTLSDFVENLTLTGSAAINGTGNALANTLAGNSGANVLSGGVGNDSINGYAGVDTLIGGAGNDVYTVDNVGDVITELSDEGIDVVSSTVSYTLSNHIEQLTLTGSSALSGTGNALANILIGNTGANQLHGAGGNDTLNGGTGIDTMVGGSGDDSYTVDNIADVVTELTAEGIDTITSSVTYTLGNHTENLTLSGSSAINGIGNALANRLVGNTGANTLTAAAGNDTLDGGSGSDTMIGGLGDDLYVVNVTTDVVTEQVSEGIDTVQSSVTLTLAGNVENLSLLGSSNLNGTGNTLNNSLVGNTANNTLTGGAGNDTLNGGAGTDSLVGGLGNDTYQLGRGYSADRITENDSTAGNQDVLQFMSGVDTDQIWFRRVNSVDLEVSIIGTTDRMTLTGWYNGNQTHVEQFTTANGDLLLDTQVANLVNAMASFAPPAVGETSLSQSYQNSLSGVIAANWS